MAQVFYPTAETVIEAALRAIAVIDPETSRQPNTTEVANALEALNFLVTSWQAHGMQVWCHKTVSYTLSAAGSYTIGPSGATITAARPLRIVQAWLRDTSTLPVDTPINIVSRDEFNLLSVKNSVGPVNQLYYDPEYDRDGSNSGANAKGKIWVWPIPDATILADYDLYMVCVRPIADFNAKTDALDFPQEWFNAVKWNLAYQLAFEYGIPVEILDRLEKRAKEELDLVLSFDTDPAPIFFQPDNRY